jgi:hypothetical protein
MADTNQNATPDNNTLQHYNSIQGQKSSFSTISSLIVVQSIIDCTVDSARLSRIGLANKSVMYE